MELVVIQELSLEAVHPQVLGVVTVKEPLERPAAATLTDAGEIANVHGGVCVTVNVCPPTVIVPVRVVGPEYAATV